MKQMTTRHYVLAGLLGSLIAVLGFTPLGMIPVPTPAGAATILHVPVILSAILEGPLFGSLVGFLFGAVSFWRSIVAPSNPISRIMFSDPFTAFLPRIMIGLVSYYVFTLARNPRWRILIAGITGVLIWDLSYRMASHYEWVSTGVTSYLLFLPLGLIVGGVLMRYLTGEYAPIIGAAIAGSMVNTVGVMGMVTLRGIIPLSASAVVAVVHGLPEAIVAVVLTLGIYKVLQGRRRGKGA